MGGRRFFVSLLESRPSLLVTFLSFLFLSFLTLFLVRPETALAQGRVPPQGPGSSAPARERESGFAQAARAVADRLAAAFSAVEGTIIGFEGDQVLIDRGASHGVFQGMELEVFREGEEFRHPLTLEALGRLDRDVGMIRVSHVRERFSLAVISKRAEKAELRQGDQVRVSMARVIVAFPNVEVEGVKGANTRSVTKDLAAALVRTGRFELIEDRQLRGMVVAERNLEALELTDTRVLKQLHERGRTQALLLGRLTPVGDRVALDVQAFSTLTGNPIILASADVGSPGAPPDRLSRAPSSDPSAAPAQGRAVPSTELRASRSSGPATSKSPELAISAAPGTQPRLSATRPSEGFRLEPEFDRSMRALAAADLDGDGRDELVLVRPDRLMVYRLDGRRLHPLGERVLNPKDAVALLEAADITGDGRAEVILNFAQKGRLHALVLQWTDRQLVPLWEAPDLVLRVLPSDGKTVHLFGQEAPKGGRASGPIRQYTWDGRAFGPGRTLDAPAALPLLGSSVAGFGGVEDRRFLTLTEGGLLELRSSAGELVSTYADSGRLSASKNGVSRRILVEPGGDGERPEVILGLEEITGNRMLRWLTGTRMSSLAALRWNGTRFEQVWSTPPAQGTLADYAILDLERGGGRYLLLLVVREGRLGFGGRSEIQAFRLQ